ncbi:hypothetical protein D9757_004828 [Collybiopsis confluens]|uniref:Zn(2)-C6 fungal-type domain-containing protein n=1 Tax=Collybiopsis confluens TaxID=2823264 RepID=A0A8H5HSJ7_9AGAR|nr:hypothetical protein D9757_004828 [Collybiopsis confluens]
MSRNLDNRYESSHRAASYHPHAQAHIAPAASSSSSSTSITYSQNMSSVSQTTHPLPIQLVPPPLPDRPKRKRLAKACDACHKSKRRCDGTAPCSNCYFASKPCTYTDASGRAVPAPRVAAMSPANAPQQVEFVNSGPHSTAQDIHPNTEARSSRVPPQSSYGHAGPPYYLPPPSLPPLHSPSQLQHRYSQHPLPSKLTDHVASRREWDGMGLPFTAPQNQESQSRKRPRMDGPEKTRQIPGKDKENDDEKEDFSNPNSPSIRSNLVGGYAARPPIELDPALTRELTNLFFTHSHPMVMIIHKPSFTNAVTMNQVPMYLLYAVCALASRHSKQPSLAASPRRHSGRQFVEEAVRLMFSSRKRSSVMGWPGNVTTDGGGSSVAGNGVQDANYASSINDLYNGDLVLPASLYTAQALCLLAMYEILATEPNSRPGHRDSKRSGGSDFDPEVDPIALSPRGERFRELSLQMLQDLGVHKPQFPLLTPVPSQNLIEDSIEKECIRRIFWLIFIVDCLRGIYYEGEDTLLGGSGRGHQPRHHSRPGTSHHGIVGHGNTIIQNPHFLQESSPPSTPPRGSSSNRHSTVSFSPPIRAFSDGFIGFTEAELKVRLPVDETSFEMGSVYECMPEYLYLPSPPAPSTDLPVYKTSASGSEIAQTIRILSIYHKLERTLDEIYRVRTTPQSVEDRPLLSSAVEENRKLFMVWDQGVHPHLRWDEDENVVVQKSMLETNSNTGAWFFFLMTILEASCVMGLGVGSRALHYNNTVARTSKESKEALQDTLKDLNLAESDWWKGTHRKARTGETDLEWGVRRLDSVLDVVGERAGSSVIMGAWLWPLIRYLNRDDEKIQKGLDAFEDFCGVRMDFLDTLTRNQWDLGLESTSSTHATNNQSVSRLILDDHSRMLDTEMDDASGEVQHEMSDTLASGSSASSTSTQGHGTDSQLPMLQTQTSLPSLKSSGLLGWSNRPSPSHPISATMHHPHPHSHGPSHLNTFVAGSIDSPIDTSASTQATASTSGSPEVASSPLSAILSSAGGSNTQPGRSGLSWMMNE